MNSSLTGKPPVKYEARISLLKSQGHTAPSDAGEALAFQVAIADARRIQKSGGKFSAFTGGRRGTGEQRLAWLRAAGHSWPTDTGAIEVLIELAERRERAAASKPSPAAKPAATEKSGLLEEFERLSNSNPGAATAFFREHKSALKLEYFFSTK